MPTPPATLQLPSTVEPIPPPKDVPWWGALILAVVVSIVSVVGTMYATRPSTGVAGQAVPPSIADLLTDSVLFLPHILILFGVLADIFTMQGAYSIPSLVGLASIPINWVFGKLLAGVGVVFNDMVEIYNTKVGATVAPAAPVRGGGMSGWDGCEIKGFEFLSSEYAPQGLVVTATVFWYYLLDLMLNRAAIDSMMTWITFLIFFVLQAMQLRACANLRDSFFLKTFIAFFEGFVIGGTGYGIVQATIPSRLPSAVLPQGPSLTSLTKQPNGTYTDGAGTPYIVGPDGRPIPVSFIQAAAGAS